MHRFLGAIRIPRRLWVLSTDPWDRIATKTFAPLHPVNEGSLFRTHPMATCPCQKLVQLDGLAESPP